MYFSLSKSDLSALECSENLKTTNISLVIATKRNFVGGTGRHKLINEDIVMTNVLCEVHSHCLDERKAFIKICGSDLIII